MDECRPAFLLNEGYIPSYKNNFNRELAKGAHYLSHTVVTAFLAWIGFLLWHWLLVGRTRSR